MRVLDKPVSKHHFIFKTCMNMLYLHNCLKYRLLLFEDSIARICIPAHKDPYGIPCCMSEVPWLRNETETTYHVRDWVPACQVIMCGEWEIE